MLSQSGPEKNSAGELETKTLEEGDLERVKDNGYSIASANGNEGALWVESPLGSGRYSMQVNDDLFLGLRPKKEG